VRNLIKTYGLERTERFIAALSISNAAGARVLGVSRSRGGQLAKILGARISTYTVDPVVQRIADEQDSQSEE